MHRVRFVIFDAIGDTAWAIIVTLLGYWFGSRIPNIDHYILPTVATVVILSFGPVIYHVVRALLARKGKLPPED
jgi:membrane-associated protein